MHICYREKKRATSELGGMFQIMQLDKKNNFYQQLNRSIFDGC